MCKGNLCRVSLCAFGQRPPLAALIFASQKSAVPKRDAKKVSLLNDYPYPGQNRARPATRPPRLDTVWACLLYWCYQGKERAAMRNIVFIAIALVLAIAATVLAFIFIVPESAGRSWALSGSSSMMPVPSSSCWWRRSSRRCTFSPRPSSCSTACSCCSTWNTATGAARTGPAAWACCAFSSGRS